MSSTWASKISRSRSPTRSYIAWMSSCAARPCWTSLMIASSAARSSASVRSRFVSSNRRAFLSATPIDEATVASSRSVESSNLCCSRLSRASTPSTSSATRIGTPSHDSASTPDWIAPSAVSSSYVPSRTGARRRMTSEVSPAPSGIGSVVDASPLVQLVAERHQVGGRVVGRDEHRGRVELLPHPLADELDDRVELELLGEAAADLVDERELGGPLAGGLDRADARQRRGDGSADDGHERDVVGRVPLVRRVGLDDERADRPVLDDQGDAQPVALADDAQAGGLAGRLELAKPLGGDELRDPGAQQVRGDARRVPDAERLPQERIRQVVVELVDVVREVDGLARIVVQRDVAVRRVGERLERLVDDRVERAQVVGPVGGVDDRDEGTLDAQLLLQLRDASRGIGVTVGAHAWLRLPDPHPLPHDAAGP